MGRCAHGSGLPDPCALPALSFIDFLKDAVGIEHE